MAAATRALERFTLRELSHVVPGLYAFLLTVALPATTPGVKAWPRIAAALPLAALFASLLLSPTRPRLSQLLGVHGFALGCLGSWLLLGPHVESGRIDPLRAGLGALGFLLHTLAWGAPPRAIGSRERLLDAGPLSPRDRVSRLPPIALLLSVLCALCPPAVAFTVTRREVSLLAHALGVGAAIACTVVSSSVALRLGTARAPLPWRNRASSAVWPLLGLTALLMLGLLWTTLRARE